MQNKKENKSIKDKEVIELTKPLDIDGTKYTSLTLDFGGLTGNDMAAAEHETRQAGYEITTVHELHKPYLLALASRAAKVNVEYLRSLPIKDATKITVLVQNFLLG